MSDSLWLIVKHTIITILFTLILRGTPVSMTSAVSAAPLTYDDGIQINSRSINAIEPSNILRKICRAEIKIILSNKKLASVVRSE